MIDPNKIKCPERYHTEVLSLEKNKKHNVFLSLETPDTLIVFVHGFTGDAINTWNKFPEKMPCTEAANKSDIVFYGYESLEVSRGIGDLSADLSRFMNSELSDTSNINRIAQSKELEAPRKYSKIIFVAHSLGAVLVRKTLISAKTSNRDWLNKTQMLLFAPAHKGSKLLELLLGVCKITTISKIVAIGIGNIYQVINDLRKDSQFLTEMREKSDYYISRGEGNFTKAQKVVWCHQDNVVYNVDFCEDPLSYKYYKSHTEICKPNEDYLSPVNHLIEIL